MIKTTRTTIKHDEVIVINPQWGRKYEKLHYVSDDKCCVKTILQSHEMMSGVFVPRNDERGICSKCVMVNTV